ncbi:MAG: hypothetical protein WAP03_12820 [Methylorubrum rhodinum]|uniref:hypothetical protein n=1 Tax=Methylorubrum rhodinum TaxID=29428 RepID=UPI003BB20C7C
MRTALVLAVLLLPASAMTQPLTKAECVAAASNDEKFADLLRKMIGIAEQQQAGDLAARQRDLGPIAQPLDQAASARARYLDAARAYLKASEDLAYQFRVCAR